MPTPETGEYVVFVSHLRRGLGFPTEVGYEDNELTGLGGGHGLPLGGQPVRNLVGQLLGLT